MELGLTTILRSYGYRPDAVSVSPKRFRHGGNHWVVCVTLSVAVRTAATWNDVRASVEQIVDTFLCDATEPDASWQISVHLPPSYECAREAKRNVASRTVHEEELRRWLLEKEAADKAARQRAILADPPLVSWMEKQLCVPESVERHIQTVWLMELKRKVDVVLNDASWCSSEHIRARAYAMIATIVQKSSMVPHALSDLALGNVSALFPDVLP